MRESLIENRLKLEVKKRGGLALKFVSPGMAGVPDRIVLIPDGQATFAETKAPGKRMKPIQLKRKAELEGLGFKVYCIDSIKAVDSFIEEVFK